MKKTYFAKSDDIKKKWYLIDAKGKVLGRLACFVSNLLRGKNKPIFTPHIDSGDFVVVVNAEKMVLTGRKLQQKTHFTHTTRPGSAKFTTYEKIMRQTPEKALYLAVKGMLPRNRMRDKFLKKLRVFRGGEHSHVSQNPEKIEVKI